MATFTIGPAIATASSCAGFCGMRGMRATPPMGSKMTSGVSIPKRRAMMIWPNSWRTTQVKMSAMKSTLSRAAGSPPFSQALTPIQARRRKKVR